MYKKFDENTFIEPAQIEYFPFAEKSQNEFKNIKANFVHSAGEINSGGKNTVKNVSKVLRAAYYVPLLMINPTLVLLTQSKHLLDIGRFLSRNDKEGILLKFKASHIVPREINHAIELYNNGSIDKAIERLNNLDNQLEGIDNADERISLLGIKAQFKAAKGAFLSAAIDMIVAATLSDAASTTSQNVDEKKVAHLSTKGQYYYSAIMLLRKYAFVHGINDDLIETIKEVAVKSELFFAKEAEYREKAGIHRTGYIDLKIAKLPTFSLGSDNKSAVLNRMVASNIRKLLYQIENRNNSELLLEYINNESYKDTNDEMILLDTLESIDLIINDNLELTSSDIKEIEKFYKYSRKTFSNELKSHYLMSLCRFHLYIGNKAKALAECMDALEYCNQSEVSDIVLLFEKVRGDFTKDEQIEIITFILNHKNSQYASSQILSYYKQLVGLDSYEDDHVSKSFHPKTSDQFQESLIKIENGQYHVKADNQIYEVNAKELRALLAVKHYSETDKKDLNIFKRIDTEVLGHSKYKEILPEVVSSNEIIDKALSFKDNIINVCDHFSELPSLKSIKKRTMNSSIKVGVFGIISTGKSTFINSLVGLDVLGTNKKVATNVRTSVLSGDIDAAEIEFLDGKKKVVNMDEIAKYTTEQGNKNNNQNIARVRISLKDCNLPKDIEIVDIPGMGAYEEEHEFHVRSVEDEIAQVDCAILIVNPEDGLNIHELDFVKKAVNEKKIPFLLIVNKIEDRDQDDLEDLEEDLIQKMKRNEINTNSLGMHFLSAKMALAGILHDEDELGYFELDKDDALEASGILKLRKELFETLNDEIKKAKNASILKRLVHDLELRKDENSQEKRSAHDALNGEDEKLRNELNQLEKLHHNLVSPLKFESNKNSLVDRFNLIDHKALIHKVNINVSDISRFSGNEEIYNGIKPSIVTVYEISRTEKIEPIYQEITRTIQDSIDQINLKSRRSYENNLNYLAELKENVTALESKGKTSIKGFIKKIINKDNAIFDLADLIVGQLIDQDIKTYTRNIDQSLLEYSSLYDSLKNRIETLNKTISMNKDELENYISNLNKSTEKINKTLELLSEIQNDMHV
jgi:small GTP-binding protein